MTSDRTRRRVLAGIGSVSGVAVTGCLGDDSEETNGGTDGRTDGRTDGTDGGDGTANENGGDSTLITNHPISQDIDAWPHRGPDPFEAPATLVVLDDPSCSRCAAFHQNTISELTANYVEAGELSIANRPYPVVYQWGEPASHALEATIDRNEAAFWGLLEHYFEDQSSFNTNNVLAETETWLGNNTDLDAAAVVDDAREEAFADRIEATLSAAEAVGAGGVTPATFAFVDGELQTSLNGSQSTETIETVLRF